MAWTFVLSDLEGVVLGEVTDAHDRVVNRVLNGISSARFTVRGSHVLAPDINSADGLLLRCYDHDKVLRFHGTVRTVEDVVRQNDYSITCTFADAGVILDGHYDSTASISHTNTDSGRLAWLVAEQRQDHQTKHGLQMGSQDDSESGSTINWQEEPYMHTLQTIVEFSESAAGFDWYIEPIERTLEGVDPVIGAWVLDGVVGTTKSNAVFEWGTGRNNVQEWQRTKDWTKLLNLALNITGEQDPEDSAGVRQQVQASDSTSIATYGTHFDVVESFGIEDSTLRQEVVDAHIAVRKNPRQIYTLTPTSSLVSVPVFGVDYYLGDLVPFRAKHNDTILFDGLVRVYSVEITIDDNGQELVKPTVEVQ